RHPPPHRRPEIPRAQNPSTDRHAPRLAGVEGLELSTSGFGDRRSSQLSYTPTSGQRLNQGPSAHGVGRSEGGRKDARAALSSNYGCPHHRAQNLGQNL